MEILRMVVELLSVILRVIGSATRPWRRLISFVLCVYIYAWTSVCAWGSRLLKVTIQLLTAPARERKISSELAQLQAKYEGLQIINCELERNHGKALHEHRQIQQKLQADVICEVNKATRRSKLLKLRIKELEEEYIKLQGIHRMASLTLHVQTREKDVEIDFLSKAPVLHVSPAAQTNRDSTFVIEPLSQTTTNALSSKICSDVGEKSCVVVELQMRRIAVVSSVFSASMSAVVAVITWHAKDRCLPLNFALFTVVGISYVNMVRFVTKVSHRFGVDAIALVSFNSFILGTLVSPFLPYFAPKIMSMWWWLLSRMGLKPEIGDEHLLLNTLSSTFVY